MCDKHCGDRSRVFGMNEEEVTTHKHEGKKSLYIKPFACGKAFNRRL